MLCRYSFMVSDVITLYAYHNVSCFFFFFFQAEDGIRDHCVTGVQTCALPIFARSKNASAKSRRPFKTETTENAKFTAKRSEERRVGKECRSWWSPYN